MDVREYGAIELEGAKWKITRAEPHVCIRLKQIFPEISKTSVAPFYFDATSENSHEIKWFMMRYPLTISHADRALMESGSKTFLNDINEREAIFLPDYKSERAILNEGAEARQYQLQARDLFWKVNRLLLADDMGLGKTLSAIISILPAECRSAAIVVQAHLPTQWAAEIKRFTGLVVHIVKSRKAYSLPPADVYIFKYTSLQGWVDLFGTRFFKTVIFDEVQELRHGATAKYQSSSVLAQNAERCMGMSGTPIYNLGHEMYNVCNLINPGCLGERSDFLREWCNCGERVGDPQALGTYLREKHIMLRRSREDVGRELPVVNKLIYTVDHDDEEVKKVEKLAEQLAMSTMVGSFMERGQAARELDIRVRQATGVSKAKSVAAWVRLILESGEPVLLAGWHRDVYEIWLKELADFNPVMYTGSESPSQKDEAKRKFIEGESDLFIISLRSGIGLDGLQKRCKWVVCGELDWSPKVHDQLITRLDRDGQQEQVTAVFLVSEWGSDPVIIDLLGIKQSQSHGILNPLETVSQQYSDESRLKLLAQQFLKNKKIPENEQTELFTEVEGTNKSVS